MSFFAQLHNYMNQNQSTGACHNKKSMCNATNYINLCYAPLFNKFFQDRSNSIWNAGVCQ